MRLTISEEYAEPYSVEVEHEELPGGGALMRVAFDDGVIFLRFSPEERREWGSLCWRVGEAVDSWLAAGVGQPYVFTQLGLRYQLQSYVHDRVKPPPIIVEVLVDLPPKRDPGPSPTLGRPPRRRK